MSQTIWIARHGNRQDYADLMWRKTAERPDDPGLSTDGIDQAKDLAQRLASEPIDHIFASPFLRTVMTASSVAEALNLPIKIEEGLCEYLNPRLLTGMPELLPIQVLAERFPQVEPTYRSRYRPAYPETAAAALDRAGQVAQDLALNFSENLLIITHDTIGKGATWGLLGIRPRVKFPMCGLTKLVQTDQQWALELNGETSHLSQTSSAVANLLNYGWRQVAALWI